jgi:large subunit ribosomal protein L5
MSTKQQSLQDQYKTSIAQKIQKELKIGNVHEIPKLEKIVISMGLGEAINNKKVISSMSEQLAAISGQQPVTTYARKSIATFKLRQGMPLGIKVTLRGDRMWDFIERLIRVVLPRVRDFRGLRKNSLDNAGNLNIGISEMVVFPEVTYEKLDMVRGLQITVVTNSLTSDHARALYAALGVPFEKQ